MDEMLREGEEWGSQAGPSLVRKVQEMETSSPLPNLRLQLP